MIPKSGNRFSEKIMLEQKISDDPDLKQTLGIPLLLIKTNKKPGIAAGGFAVPRVCLKQIPLRGVA
jgi:hypothetical protein